MQDNTINITQVNNHLIVTGNGTKYIENILKTKYNAV